MSVSIETNIIKDCNFTYLLLLNVSTSKMYTNLNTNLF